MPGIRGVATICLVCEEGQRYAWYARNGNDMPGIRRVATICLECEEWHRYALYVRVGNDIPCMRGLATICLVCEEWQRYAWYVRCGNDMPDMRGVAQYARMRTPRTWSLDTDCVEQGQLSLAAMAIRALARKWTFDTVHILT